MQTVLGAFDDKAQAERAVDRLVERGFDRGDVHIEQRGGATTTTASADAPREEHHKGFFARLFGLDDDDDTQVEHAGTYHEAVQRGSSVVVVDARDEAQAEQAVACLHEFGAVDVDERARQWRAEGWSPRTAMGRQDSVRDDAPGAGREGVLDVVQEELQVGKRRLDQGGVRVIQRVTEQPVREVVRLHEEHAVVSRQKVDRQATAGDLDTFKEGTLEVRESVEEPVVAKTARVVEEVRVGKEARDREQVVEDKVRRKDVEVERIEGSGRGTVERERAVASDRTGVPLSERDPDAGGASLTGTRKPRKNDPQT